MVTTVKLNEVLDHLRKYQVNKLQTISLSDLKHPLKGSTLQLLADIFHVARPTARLSLSLSRCFLYSEKTLNEFFQTPSNLTQLNLSDVGLCDEHLYEIATFLDESCKGLKVLHLQRNNIGLEGAMSLAQGLVDNQNLKLLNLSYNKIGSKGVILLVEAFRGNRTLRSLFLDANGIENDGSYALADMLLEKTSGLEELHIGTNMISHAGLSAIFMAVAMTNKSLKFLDVAYNFIDVGIMHQLRQLLLRNTTLKYFSISDLHRFTAQAIDGVVDSLLKEQVFCLWCATRSKVGRCARKCSDACVVLICLWYAHASFQTNVFCLSPWPDFWRQIPSEELDGWFPSD